MSNAAPASFLSARSTSARIAVASSSPLMFARRNRNTTGLCSTKTTDAAPRDSASMPSEPPPAKRSQTFAPATRPPTMLNIACRVMSLVGRKPGTRVRKLAPLEPAGADTHQRTIAGGIGFQARGRDGRGRPVGRNGLALRPEHDNRGQFVALAGRVVFHRLLHQLHVEPVGTRRLPRSRRCRWRRRSRPGSPSLSLSICAVPSGSFGPRMTHS